eukprot:jgi/Chlat1/5734/Chrsp38S05562
MATQHANAGHVVNVETQGIVAEGPSAAGVESRAAQFEERSQPAGPSNRAWQPHCYEDVEGFVFSGKGHVPREDEAGVVVLGPDGSLFVGLPPDAIAKQKRRAEEEQANANLESTYETALGAREPVLPLTANDANQVPLAFQMLHRRRVRALMLLLVVDLAYAIASFAVDQSHNDPSPPPPPSWLSPPPLSSTRGFFTNNGPTFLDYAQLVSHVIVNVIGMAACDASARSMTVFLVLEVVITALSAVQKLTPILFIRIIIILIAVQVRSGMIAMAAMRRSPDSQTASRLLARLREWLGRTSPRDGPTSSQSLPEQQRVSVQSNNVVQNPAVLQSHARLYTSHLLLHLFRHPPDQSRVHRDAIHSAP